MVLDGYHSWSNGHTTVSPSVTSSSIVKRRSPKAVRSTLASPCIDSGPRGYQEETSALLPAKIAPALRLL